MGGALGDLVRVPQTHTCTGASENSPEKGLDPTPRVLAACTARPLQGPRVTRQGCPFFKGCPAWPLHAAPGQPESSIHTPGPLRESHSLRALAHASTSSQQTHTPSCLSCAHQMRTRRLLTPPTCASWYLRAAGTRPTLRAVRHTPLRLPVPQGSVRSGWVGSSPGGDETYTKARTPAGFTHTVWGCFLFHYSLPLPNYASLGK